MDFTTAMLQERKKTHGSYDDDARCAMRLLDVLTTEEQRRDSTLTHIQRHALRMILHKVARIVAGDPNFKDHWDDIGGYAELAARWCAPEKVEEPTGCADDCVHPSHRHNCQDEPLTGKPPCHCTNGRCQADGGLPPRYVYCKKAEAAESEAPLCHCEGVDCLKEFHGGPPHGTRCRRIKAEYADKKVPRYLAENGGPSVNGGA